MPVKDDARLRIEVRFPGLEARDILHQVAVLVVVAAQDDECVIM